MKNHLDNNCNDIFKSTFKAYIHNPSVHGLCLNIPKGHNRFYFGKKVT